jgi:hypothetical protein
MLQIAIQKSFANPIPACATEHDGPLGGVVPMQLAKPSWQQGDQGGRDAWEPWKILDIAVLVGAPRVCDGSHFRPSLNEGGCLAPQLEHWRPWGWI